MKNNERVRNYALVTYHPIEVIEKVLAELCNAGRIRHYAYILHDKDLDQEGKLKEKHLHILVQLNNAMTLTAVRALFPIGANTLAQPIYDKADCFNYLTHKDKPDKHQYSDDDIVADNVEYWKGLQKGEADDRTMCIIDDILAKVPYRTMVMRYGRDFVINRDKYCHIALLISAEEEDISNRQVAKPKPYLIDEDGVIVKPTPKQMEIEP